jgi:gliding motility-associated-like protein
LLNLAAPIVKGGKYILSLQKGSDGNTIYNQCARSTPAGSSLSFELKDTVSASFTHQIEYGCDSAVVFLKNNGDNGITKWTWISENGIRDSLPQLKYVDTSFEPFRIKLQVSNGVCSDSSILSLRFNKDYQAKADFEMPEFVCPNDEATFVDHSVGDIIYRKWDFGNGHTSFLTSPPRQQYPAVVRTKEVPVRLAIENAIGCRDTMVKMLKVINNCFIAVPTAFTPNGDGMNDYLYPLNAYKARDLDFRVYNRYGQKVFETRDWTQKWDGTLHGQKQPTGSYVWMLTFTNTDTGEKVFKKGATLLIR